MHAVDLHVGEQVRRLDGSTGTVRGFVLIAQQQLMYNLTVAQAHTFFVGSGHWLVHNTGCNPAKGTTLYRQLMNKLTKAKYQSGNSSIGEATAEEAEWMGKKWVGENYRVNSDGSWTSADGLRQYRPPSLKSSPYATTGTQANFESRAISEG